MVDIISAREAFNESKYRKEADEILTTLVSKIKEACNNGKFYVSMSIDARTKKGAIDLAIDDLKKKGYKAAFIEDTAEIEHYWDYIDINWNLSTEKGV